MADVSPLDIEENPSWLLDAPDIDDIAPPVDTLDQELPFDQLSWQNFERLCLKLAATDGNAESYRCCRLRRRLGRLVAAVHLVRPSGAGVDH